MITSLARFAVDSSYLYATPTVSQPQQTALTAGMMVVLVLVWAMVMGLAVLMLIGLWKMYRKAGKPGWASIVPFYNVWVLAEIAGKPGWWGLYPFLALVPFVGWIAVIVLSIIIALSLAKNFGKSEVFGVFGLWLFSSIGYMILGFGSATYQAMPAQAPQQPMPPVSPVPPSPIQ